jgi:small subunit ribosomal protein S1
MSKELIKPQQFGRVEIRWNDEEFQIPEEQKAELDALYQGELDAYKQGNVVTGSILAISHDGIQVDIKFKSYGLIPLHEFTEHELKKLVVGSPIEVMIDELEDVNGSVILSYEKAKELRAWDRIMKLYHDNQPVEGTVTHKVKGGLSVDIGVQAFLPGSQVDLQRVADFDQYVNQTVTAYILKVNPKRGNVIISRRKYLHEQRAEVRKKVLDTLDVNQVLRGTVKNITNYGAFIDIGGVDGLLHITDMTWGRISHPSEVLSIGDTITVKVLSFDKEHEKISLGMKQLSENPWEVLPETVQVGSRVKGRVSSIADYGLFVEVARGVEGLVHISEISWTDRITDLHKYFKIGQEVEALVVSLDKENRRMSLSVKQLEKSPWDAAAEQLFIGQRIKGTVSNITDFGIFVQIMPGVDGLVHVSDLSWTEHIKNPSELYKKGDTVEAVIIDINKQKRKVSLSVKHLIDNPWETIEQAHPVGSALEGEITKAADFGYFIKLDNGIEGLIPQSEVGDTAPSVGQRVSCTVIKVSQEERKITLSLKNEEDRAAHAAARSARSDRGERSDRGDRGERGDKRERSGDRRPRQSEMSAASPVKAKSALQIELEKHMARLNDTPSNDKGE